MPRIRTIKPEALTHRKVGRLSDRAFRLWIGCLTQADDHGRLIFDVDQCRLLIWGYHTALKRREVVSAATELLASGLVRGYAVDKSVDKSPTLFFDFPSWSDHQKVDHPRKSTLPACSTQGVELFSRAFTQLREDSRDLARLRGGSEGSEGRKDLRARAREGNEDARTRDPTRGPVRSSVSSSSEQRGEDDASGQRQARSETRQSSGPLVGALAAVLAQIRVMPERARDPVPREHVEI